MLMLIGTYTRNTESAGIYCFAVSDDVKSFMPGKINEGVDNPSWLVAHPRLPVVYAVNEVRDMDGGGAISAFYRDGNGQLTLIGRKPSMGGDPCHLAIAPDGRTLFVANYGGGNLASLPLGAGGELGDFESLVQHGGKGVDPMRQQGPHVHSITLDADAQFAYVCDLGLDQVVCYPLASHGAILADQRKTTRLKPGAGPRMLCFDSACHFAFVINELDNTLVSFERNASGQLVELSTVSALPEGYTDASYCAHILVSGDDRFVYASNRGHDSIAVFEKEGDGRLNLAQHQSTLGRHPRHFTFSPDQRYLLVANRDSNNIVVMERNADSGRLAPTGRSIAVPAPVSILFTPGP